MQLVHSFRIGGSEKLALDIAGHLDRSRWVPSACALDVDGALGKELDAAGIPRFVMHRRGIEVDVMRRLYRLFRDNRIDVVHTHHFAQLFYALLPARLAGARVVHTEHEYFTYADARIARMMIGPLVRFCSVMTVVGQEVGDHFVEVLGVPSRRVVVVRNGVDLRAFDDDRRAARRELGLDESAFVLGTVGRLEPEKDQGTLLEVFRRVTATRPEARLVLVGDGTLAEELKSHAERLGVLDRVSFLGFRRDIGRVLAAMDVFILSSVREGLPISIIEAMAARRPVVASDVGSVRDVVRDGVDGFVVPAREVEAFVDAVHRLGGAPDLMARMGESGRAAVEARFSLAEMVKAYEALYRAAAGGSDVRH